MRRVFLLTVILAELCVGGFAQSKDKPAGGAEQAVTRIERELLSALLKGDASATPAFDSR